MTASNVLYRKCKKSYDQATIQETIQTLNEALDKNKTSTMSLSANQIGIDESICIVRVTRELILINPEIIEHSTDTFQFHESCISFPSTYVKVNRYKKIVVKSDNNGLLDFEFREYDNLNNIELACVQHEIDHLNGITMFDRKK
jgi:peptide deformylase